MNTLVFILLLVSCTDDFNSCYSNDKMVKIYPTAQTCEQAMIPSTKQFSSYGQQIFAQCTRVLTNSHQQEIKLTWSVTNRGNLLIKSQNMNETISKIPKANVFLTSSPLLRFSPIDLLHKKP
ncbi:hypothetical protein [Bartonella alsatica]|uniref:hypothetical protein n=1 Tax=Bartonella alsatica TaxID=52764 RepID=UPI00058F8F22|nr:hypothetical protein [Bartonella alsatica]